MVFNLADASEALESLIKCRFLGLIGRPTGGSAVGSGCPNIEKAPKVTLIHRIPIYRMPLKTPSLYLLEGGQSKKKISMWCEEFKKCKVL